MAYLGKGESIWDKLAFERKGDTGENTCDTYYRVDEDIRNLQKLGVCVTLSNYITTGKMFASKRSHVYDQHFDSCFIVTYSLNHCAFDALLHLVKTYHLYILMQPESKLFKMSSLGLFYTTEFLFILRSITTMSYINLIIYEHPCRR